ncbi:MAG TPA: hypothetical protein VH855_02505 [Acetobacteraceae bacterium]
MQRDRWIRPANLTGTVTSTDRRCAGGTEAVAEPDDGPATIPSASGDDPLAPARGILLGCAIGASVWVAAGLAAWLLL